jgi:hypothetical protein
MYKYYYTREIVDNAYNIDNPARVDGQGNKILLAQEIEILFPNKKFRVFCSNDLATVVFDDMALTDSEKIDLDECIYNHKNNL